MPRDQKQTATKVLRNPTSSHPHMAGRTFSNRFRNEFEHYKIKEWFFLAAGLLTFLAVYFFFLNLLIWARLPVH